VKDEYRKKLTASLLNDGNLLRDQTKILAFKRKKVLGTSRAIKNAGDFLLESTLGVYPERKIHRKIPQVFRLFPYSCFFDHLLSVFLTSWKNSVK
jgi:hypothetical protein